MPPMNKAAKLLDAMRANPRDWRIEHLLTIADSIGLAVRNRRGSHHFFSSPLVEQALSVPAHKPIKPTYIKQFLALVDAVEKEKRQ